MPIIHNAYMIKIRHTGELTAWERIPGHIVHASNMLIAAAKVCKVEDSFDLIKEIRINEMNSLQGHYFVLQDVAEYLK